VSFSIEVRAATRREIARCEKPSHASMEDGAAAIVVDGDVAITNEYGTALLVAGSNATPTRDQVETFVQAAMDFFDAGTCA
jgi:predicted naringenin-chalcone synthase